MEYGSTGGGCYPVRLSVDEAAIIYFTEVRAIQLPFDPEISADADVVASSPIIDSAANAHLTPSNNAAGVQAPTGFNTVTNFFSASGNTWASKILGADDFAKDDLSCYSEVWFAIAITGGHFTNTADGWKQLDADNKLVWINFHLTQADDGTWTVEMHVDGALYNTFVGKPGQTIYNILENNNNGLRLVVYQQTADNISNADVNIYATEVLAVAKPLPPFDPQIPANTETVWQHIWNNYYFTGGGKPEGAWSEEAAPQGFTKVSEYSWKTTTKSNGQLNQDFPLIGHFNDSTDISKYSDLYFAMKVENGSEIYIQGNTAYTGGDWLYVHMYQAANGTWSKDYYSVDGYTCYGKHTGLTGTTLPSMMTWVSGVNTGSFPKSTTDIDVTTTAYFTEVIGVKKPFDPQIPDTAEKVRDSIWRSNNYALSATTTEAVPAGFSVVKEFNWLHNTTMVDDKTGTGNTIPYASNLNDLPLTCFDEAVVSSYTDVYFAIKMVGGAGIYVGSASKYTGGNWLYAHYAKQGDGTWTLSVRSADGYEKINVQRGIVGDNLQTIMGWKNLDSVSSGMRQGLYPTKAADSTEAIVYMTDMRAVAVEER